MRVPHIRHILFGFAEIFQEFEAEALSSHASQIDVRLSDRAPDVDADVGSGLMPITQLA